MGTQSKPRVIAIEEHYWDQELAATFGPRYQAPGIVDRLYDYGELRIQEMDEAGIDFQVLSHGPPATQRGDAEATVKLARSANDRSARLFAPIRTGSRRLPACRRRTQRRPQTSWSVA